MFLGWIQGRKLLSMFTISVRYVGICMYMHMHAHMQACMHTTQSTYNK